MNEIPRQKLCEIIQKYSASLCHDPVRLEGLLRDFCGQYRKEISLLVSATKERVTADLLTSPSSLPVETLLARLTNRLQDNLGLAEDAARWAVETWALALGVISNIEERTSQYSQLQSSSLPSQTPLDSHSQSNNILQPTDEIYHQEPSQLPISYPGNAPIQQYPVQNITSSPHYPVVPSEVKGWNWGAFLLCPIWSIGNGVWIGLLSLIPLTGFAMNIILAIKGNEWAWESGRWSTVEEFKKNQRRWAIAGFIIFAIFTFLCFLILISSS
jgi:hypothetical protein